MPEIFYFGRSGTVTAKDVPTIRNIINLPPHITLGEMLVKMLAAGYTVIEPLHHQPWGEDSVVMQDRETGMVFEYEEKCHTTHGR